MRPRYSCTGIAVVWHNAVLQADAAGMDLSLKGGPNRRATNGPALLPVSREVSQCLV
jgi:hypothetical protein